MKKSMFFLTVIALLCLPSLGLPYSVTWYEPLLGSGSPITGVEIYITGGTFTGQLTDFREGYTGSGSLLSGWSSFLASNYPGTAVVAYLAKGDPQDVFSFNINLDQPQRGTRLDFYPYYLDRTTLVSPESWIFRYGTWMQDFAAPLNLPSDPPIDPSIVSFTTASFTPQVPEPSTLFLLGTGLMGIWGARRRFRK
jgi:hypothetical protein